MLHRMIAAIATALVCIPGALGAQDHNLFGHTTDPKRITAQIQMGLSAVERGFAQLQRASNTQEINQAVDSIWDSYRYLRSAQESSENLEAHAKFPDPLVKLRNARILQARDHIRWCPEHRGQLLAQDPETTAQCIAGLVEAIRSLRVVAATTN
jgi:hypothetical protein